MKKRSMLVLAAFAGLCLILYACSKELRHPPDQRESASSVVTLAAKQWYAGHTAAPLTAAQKRSPRRLSPLWQKGWMVEGADRTQYFVVPAPERRVNNKDLSIRRFFVFETDGDAVKAGYITEMIGVKYDVEKNLDLLLRHHKSNGIEGFTGSIFTYDLNYRALKKKTFGGLAGMKVHGDIQLFNKGDGNARKAAAAGSAYCWPAHPILVGFPPENLTDDCVYTVYVISHYDAQGCPVEIIYYYITHNCPPPPEGGGEEEPGSGGDGYTPPYGNVFTYVKHMETDMQSMCYNNMFRIMRESPGNWHRDVSVLANSLMSTLSLDIYIRFHESTALGADYQGTGTLSIAGTHGALYLDVTLGTYGLQYASKEWLTSIMSHGCMEAVLDAYNAWPAVNNDDVWAYDYIVGHYTTLLEMFPNMPIAHAEYMGWKGLESTHYYAQDMIDNPGQMAARYDVMQLYRTRQDGTGTDCMAAY